MTINPVDVEPVLTKVIATLSLVGQFLVLWGKKKK